MNQNDELEKQIKNYQDLAKEDKNIDVATLMMNAIENHHRNLISAKQKKWAYLISIGLPPLGLLFALKLYFGDEDDAKRVANICVLLTVIAGVIVWLGMAAIFSSSGVSMQQIEQINPKEVQQLYQ